MLPASFQKIGFQSAATVRNKRRNLKTGGYLKGILIGTEGEPNTGKTEFMLSAPGPGLIICLDRGFDAALDNPTPPPTRRGDFGFKVVLAPQPTAAKQDTFLDYWRSFYEDYKAMLALDECITGGIDGDSDSWELQRLAEFGKLTQIPPHLYVSVNASRRAMISRAYDSGKICIFTNKLKKEYVDEVDAQGNPILGNDGKPKRKASGQLIRQGFDDHGYLFALQLRHLYKEAQTITVQGRQVEIPQQWGIRILICKAQKALEGLELWGGDCNFQTLMQVVYPHIPLSDWGY